MTRRPPKVDRRREQRILEEIVVDAYTAEERAMGWYYYLQENLRFPFQARCTQTLATSPLDLGEMITVTGLAPEEHCLAQVIVKTTCAARSLGVPLAQLSPQAVDPDTQTAVDDWLYWTAQGYQY